MKIVYSWTTGSPAFKNCFSSSRAETRRGKNHKLIHVGSEKISVMTASRSRRAPRHREARRFAPIEAVERAFKTVNEKSSELPKRTARNARVVASVP